MRISLLLLALGLVVVAAVPKTPQRIVGGSVTNIGQYPYAAALLHSASGTIYWHICGATILNNRSILTAGHCIWRISASQLRIRIGSTFANSGGAVHNINRLIIHPKYNSRNLDNDVAILRASSNFAFNNNARPASIAGPNYNLGDNQVVWAIGWGATSFNGERSEQLRHVQIWSVNHSTCRHRYATRGMDVTDNMLCSGWLDVGGRDQCLGDSGGPLLHNNVVVGVCSWGHQCGHAFFPGVNARVSRYTSWIQTNA